MSQSLGEEVDNRVLEIVLDGSQVVIYIELCRYLRGESTMKPGVDPDVGRGLASIGLGALARTMHIQGYQTIIDSNRSTLSL